MLNVTHTCLGERLGYYCVSRKLVFSSHNNHIKFLSFFVCLFLSSFSSLIGQSWSQLHLLPQLGRGFWRLEETSTLPSLPQAETFSRTTL